MSGYGGGGGGRQQSFSFPMLSNDEILACMEELQISMDPKDLEKPSAVSVRHVYEALCEVCIGITKEEINSGPLGAEETENLMTELEVEFPELHGDSIPQLRFLSAVSRLMSASGVHDTRLWDIVKPEAKRFKRNMSAVINFAKFREERLMKFQELSEKTEELFEIREQSELENHKITEEINRLKLDREKEKPQIERLQKECQQLEDEINDFNKQQSKLKYEVGNLKEKRSQLRDQLASIEFQKLNTRQESERIQKNIVKSPERIKRELRTEQRQLEKSREENAAIKENLRSLQSKLEHIEKSESDISSVYQLIEDIEQEFVKCKSASKEQKKMSAAIKAHASLTKQLLSTKKEMEKQLQIMNDRVARLKKQRDIKKTTLNQEEERVLSEMKDFQNLQKKNNNEAKENKKKD
mmetsp:Transcript_13300/g.17332  ORF Transcript_13300/g.17332 Transcript_13300/m.17332 type:complete len:412 (-) Transcript_13300:910-2145(-)